MRRTPLFEVRSWAEVRRLAEHVAATTLVVDVEPSLQRWGATDPVDVDAAIRTVLDGTDGVRRLLLVTNSPLRCSGPVSRRTGALSTEFLGSARKPFTPLTRLPRTDGPVLVVGDQVLTDGLLAVRLGAVFGFWPATGQVPLWPRLQTALARPLLRLVFGLRTVPRQETDT